MITRQGRACDSQYRRKLEEKQLEHVVTNQHYTYNREVNKVAETLQNLSDAQMIAEHVARTILSVAQYPTFPPGNVPVSVAQKVFGKSGTWVRKGMEDGWLDIGIATGNGSRGNYYISPKKLWELTGYLWDGKS